MATRASRLQTAREAQDQADREIQYILDQLGPIQARLTREELTRRRHRRYLQLSWTHRDIPVADSPPQVLGRPTHRMRGWDRVFEDGLVLPPEMRCRIRVGEYQAPFRGGQLPGWFIVAELSAQRRFYRRVIHGAGRHPRDFERRWTEIPDDLVG